MFNLTVIKDEVWFVPDIGDNRISDKPFKILIEPLTYAEYQAATEDVDEELSNLKAEDIKKIGVTARFWRLREHVLRQSILDFANGTVTITEDGKERIDALNSVLFIQYAPDELQTHVFLAIKDHSRLAEGLEKK